jgi:REP element-mobilizing transposase RayT
MGLSRPEHGSISTIGAPGVRARWRHGQPQTSLRSVFPIRQRVLIDHSNPRPRTVLIDTLRFVERKGFSHSLAWVVMPDHLHWLMELRSGTLAECMSLLKSRSSRLLNRRLERRGALWQHGYHDHAVRSDESLHEKVMYILANPVRAGLAGTLGEYLHAWCRWPL